MKRILIPTDFSVCAQAATEVALEIARVFDAHVYFLHMHMDTAVSHHVPAVHQQEEPDHEAGHVKGLLDELTRQAGRMGVQATPVLVQSKGNDHVEDYIKPYGIDWIVMGSHGASGVEELLLGSHTERVVKHSTVPVLVIKKRPKIVTFRNIVFASTFEHDENMGNAIGECLDFAKPFEAQIHLLYLNFVNKLVQEGTALARMQRVANLYPLYSFTTNIIETNDAEWGIDVFVRKAGCDLIAMMPQDTQSVIRVMSRRIAWSLVNHEAIPVLVLNSK